MHDSVITDTFLSHHLFYKAYSNIPFYVITSVWSVEMVGHHHA